MYTFPFSLRRVGLLAAIICLLGFGAMAQTFMEYADGTHKFAAGGAGSVARDVALKLDEFRSVKDYGAKGDGINDDTKALDSAIATGANLFFPPGTYLLKKSLSLKDNQKLMGAGWSSVISVMLDNVIAIQATGKTNLGVYQLKIDGNGNKLTEGIRLTNCRYSAISDVWITNMGAVNTADIKSDNTHGGVGILLSSEGGECAWITVERCRIDHIVSGGYFKGDGVEVGDYDVSPSTAHDIVVRNCRVSTVGRHCYAAGGNQPQKPYNILFENCYGEKSGLDWLDVEDAQSVRVVNGVARRCGNDQTYYNPAAAYGTNYALLAAIAVGNASGKVEILGFSADSCYAGCTFGGSASVELDRVTISNSAYADYFMGLANFPLELTIRNSAFLTPGKSSLFYFDGTASTKPKRFTNVTFASPLKLSQSVNVRFEGCEFRAGLAFQSALIKDIEVNGCRFTDFAGAGISWSNFIQRTDRLTVRNCQFLGAGQMTYGINAIWGSLYRSVIADNLFSGLTTAGIGHANMAGDSLVFDILRNRFVNMPIGIDLHQATRRMRISGNSFDNISSWTISQTDIFSSTKSNSDNLITENIAGEGVVNGIQIKKNNGVIEYNMIIGNNFRNVTGATKIDIDGTTNIKANNMP